MPCWFWPTCATATLWSGWPPGSASGSASCGGTCGKVSTCSPRQLPASGQGASIATGFARAIYQGPVGLSVHALLGVILIVSALTALVRAVLVRRPALVGATAVGLVTVVMAALSGASFVGDGSNSSSMGMAVAGGVAVAAYALVLLPSAGIAVSPRP